MTVKTIELKHCPFCGKLPDVLHDSLQPRIFKLQHNCMWFANTFVIDWCEMERLVRLWNTRHKEGS